MSAPAQLAGTRLRRSATSLATSADGSFCFLKGFGKFCVSLCDKLHRITNLNALEQIFYVLIAHPDASVRRRFANRLRPVGSMNAVAFVAEPHPAGAERIGGCCGNHFSRLIPGGFHDAAYDVEAAVRAGRAVLADGDWIYLHQ